MAEAVYQHLHVVRVIREGDAGVTLILDEAIPCQPGQFVMVWVPGIEERPFTLMDDNPASLTVAAIGPLTRALCALRAGDPVWLRGPYGHGYPEPAERVLLIGGGSGIASLALFAKHARACGSQVHTAIGARCAPLLMLDWLFADFSDKLIIATDDGSRGVHGSVLAAAAPELPWAGGVYACGPEGMLKALALQHAPGDPPCWVNLERVMRCGIGVCGSCHCGEKLVCADGPVFPIEVAAPALGLTHPESS